MVQIPDRKTDIDIREAQKEMNLCKVSIAGSKDANFPVHKVSKLSTESDGMHGQSKL